MSRRVPVRPFSPRGFCPMCKSTNVTRKHHDPLSALLVACGECGHTSATETAEAPIDKHAVSRTIELPSDDDAEVS